MAQEELNAADAEKITGIAILSFIRCRHHYYSLDTTRNCLSKRFLSLFPGNMLKLNIFKLWVFNNVPSNWNCMACNLFLE